MNFLFGFIADGQQQNVKHFYRIRVCSYYEHFLLTAITHIEYTCFNGQNTC